ncbi:MAG: GTPase ObgE [Chlamydiales bacterium]
MFTDKIKISLIAGKGGNGVVAWRRERYIPKGGPYGGNGGPGGSVIFEADEQIPSLDAFRFQRIAKAEAGGSGGPNRRQGKRGRDLILKVPPGTIVRDQETGEVLYDFTEPQEQWSACQGGRGGLGNSHFKTAVNRAPNYATPGKFGEELKVELELKLIADVGLVGFPNAGKSTLISQVTQAKAKIGAYPFTTLKPNLGFHYLGYGKRILFADIPGIIEGASNNRGLGLEFLRHIERTSVLLFVIDGAPVVEDRDPIQDFAILEKELLAYSPQLLQKPIVVALNKCDENPESFDRFVKAYPRLETVSISALTGEGIEKLIALLKRKLNK